MRARQNRDRSRRPGAFVSVFPASCRARGVTFRMTRRRTRMSWRSRCALAREGVPRFAPFRRIRLLPSPLSAPDASLSLSRAQVDRESIVFLIDASPAMLESAPAPVAASIPGAAPRSRTYLDVAVECAHGMLRSRIVSAPGDKQGVLFFHTRESRGLDDAPGGLSVREGVYVDQRMSIPSARRIQHLADLVGPEGNARFRAKVGCGPAPDPDDGYYDALLKAHHVAREMLNDHPPGARVAKRALLFTNRDDPRRPGEDGRELVSQWREFRDVHRVDVRLFTLPRTRAGDDFRSARRDDITARVLGVRALGRDDADAEDADAVRVREFDPSVFYRHLVEVDDDDANDDMSREKEKSSHDADVRSADVRSAYVHGHEVVACSADRVERLTLDFRKSSRRRRGSRATTLRFGVGARDAIAVRVHAPLAEARRPTPVALHSRDLSEVYADTVFVSNAVGEYVAAEHLTRRCVEYGGSRVVLTRAEIAEAKRACGSEGAHVLGFRPRDVILRRWAQTARPARFMTPADEATQPGATAAFAALVRAMATRRVVAVVLFARVGERDAGARCAALVPAETEDGAHHGLHVVYLPFADDVRYPERAHDAQRIHTRREDDDAEGSLGATEAQIRAAEQAVDALAVHSYDPSDISNPTLARHHRALESQALNRAWTADDDVAGDATEPPGEDELAALGAREPVEAFKTAAYGANHDEEVAAAMAAAGARGTKRKAAAGGGLSDDVVDYKALAEAGELDRVVAARLKEYCKANGLPTTGVKATLVERVAAHATGA